MWARGTQKHPPLTCIHTSSSESSATDTRWRTITSPSPSLCDSLVLLLNPSVPVWSFSPVIQTVQEEFNRTRIPTVLGNQQQRSHMCLFDAKPQTLMWFPRESNVFQKSVTEKPASFPICHSYGPALGAFSHLSTSHFVKVAQMNSNKTLMLMWNLSFFSQELYYVKND